VQGQGAADGFARQLLCVREREGTQASRRSGLSSFVIVVFLRRGTQPSTKTFVN